MDVERLLEIRYSCLYPALLKIQIVQVYVRHCDD